MPTDSHHYENLATLAAKTAHTAFDRYRADELSGANLVKRLEVRAAYDLINPRIDSLAQEVMDAVYDDFAKLTINELLELLDARRAKLGLAPHDRQPTGTAE